MSLSEKEWCMCIIKHVDKPMLGPELIFFIKGPIKILKVCPLSSSEDMYLTKWESLKSVLLSLIIGDR